jgi:hypothetical protein
MSFILLSFLISYAILLKIHRSLYFCTAHNNEKANIWIVPILRLTYTMTITCLTVKGKWNTSSKSTLLPPLLRCLQQEFTYRTQRPFGKNSSTPTAL